jgi:S-adenosylmethionine:tRNA ribosyltransferase-isomerase
MTRLLIHPGRGVFAVDGLLTGFHDPGASHLAMLYAVAGTDLVRDGYEEAIKGRYLWHEFGDSHLLLPR